MTQDTQWARVYRLCEADRGRRHDGSPGLLKEDILKRDKLPFGLAFPVYFSVTI